MTKTFPVTPGESPQKAPCEGCGRRTPVDDLHPLEYREEDCLKERYLCAMCCPNCYGGKGIGPDGPDDGFREGCTCGLIGPYAAIDSYHLDHCALRIRNREPKS